MPFAGISGCHRRHHKQFLGTIGKTRQTISRDTAIVKIDLAALFIPTRLSYNPRGYELEPTERMPMIHLLTSRVTPRQLTEMLEELEDYIKPAVDIEQGIAAGGGELHAYCEAVLLSNGSQRENVWGADWDPLVQEVRYESFINIAQAKTIRRWRSLTLSFGPASRRSSESFLGEYERQ
jgi:hypothetical protein